MTAPKRIGGVFLLLFAAQLTALWHRYGICAVTQAYNGQSFALANNALAAHRAQYPLLHTLHYYLSFVPLVYLWIWLGSFAIWLGVFEVFVGGGFQRVKSSLQEFLLEPDSAYNLAILRIIACSTTLAAIVFEAPLILSLSQVPRTLRIPPQGLHWLFLVIPFSPNTTLAILALSAIAALCGTVGLFAQVSSGILCIATIWLFGGIFSFGNLSHTLHMFPPVLAILATSRCADVFAINAPPQVPARSALYGLPLRMLWLVIGLSYFFPGLWKLLFSGPSYIFGDNLRNLLWILGYDHPIALYFAEHVVICRLLGTVVILWEILFVLCVPSKRLRNIWAVVGVGIHAGIYLCLGILFVPLLIMYLSFVPWDSLLRLRSAVSDYVRPPKISVAVGSVIIAGYIFTGILRIHTYPISCYPTFSGPQSDLTEHVAITMVRGDRVETPRPDQVMRSVFSPHLWDAVEEQVSTEFARDENAPWAKRVLDYWDAREPLPANALGTRIYLDLIKADPQDKFAVVQHRLVREWPNQTWKSATGYRR